MPPTPPKLDFVFIFAAVFEISMKSVCFGGPFFSAMRGLNGEMSAMRHVSSDACDALETAWHFSCDLGSAVRSCDAHRAICDARCGTAKVAQLSKNVRDC